MPISMSATNLKLGNAESPREYTNLKTVIFIPMKHFHVTNCDPVTSQYSLRQNLAEIIPDIQVERLKSRNATKYSLPSLKTPIVLHCNQMVWWRISFFI